MSELYDHRASIVAYMEAQADKFQKSGDKDSDVLMRAMAQNLRGGLDMEAGQRNLASPAYYIATLVGAELGYTADAIMAQGRGSNALQPARDATYWVTHRRTGATHSSLARMFHRSSPETAENHLARANAHREDNEAFREMTDRLAEQPMHCANCGTALGG